MLRVVASRHFKSLQVASHFKSLQVASHFKSLQVASHFESLQVTSSHFKSRSCCFPCFFNFLSLADITANFVAIMIAKMAPCMQQLFTYSAEQ